MANNGFIVLKNSKFSGSQNLIATHIFQKHGVILSCKRMSCPLPISQEFYMCPHI
jgi:hypothetical protein